MNRLMKGFGVLVAGVIALSLVGQGEIAGLFGIAFGLVLVIALAVRSGRPAYAGVGGGGYRSARRINFVARYKFEAVPRAALAGSAFWSALVVASRTGEIRSLALSGAAAAVLSGMFPRVMGFVFGAIGVAATLVEIFSNLGCGEGVSAQGRTVFALLFLASVATVVVVRLHLLPMPRIIDKRLTLEDMALLVFGVAEMAALIVNPAGLDVFPGTAPYWLVTLAALVIVVVISALAGYAPTFILGLVALVGIALPYAIDVVDTAPLKAHCPSPFQTAAFVVVFAFAATVLLSLKPGP